MRRRGIAQAGTAAVAAAVLLGGGIAMAGQTDPRSDSGSAATAPGDGWRDRVAQRLLLGQPSQERLAAISDRLGVSEQVLEETIAQARQEVAAAHGMTVEELALAIEDGTLEPLSPADRAALLATLTELREDAGLPGRDERLAMRAERLGVSVDTLKEFRSGAAGLAAEAHGMSVDELRSSFRDGTLQPLTRQERTALRSGIQDLRSELGLPQGPQRPRAGAASG